MPYKLCNHARLTRVEYFLRRHLRPHQHLRRVVKVGRRKKGNACSRSSRGAWLGTNDYSSFCLINVFITASSSFIASSLIWMPSSTDGRALVCQLLGQGGERGTSDEGGVRKWERSDGSFITVGKRKWAVAWPCSDSACDAAGAARVAELPNRSVSRTMICGASMMKL